MLTAIMLTVASPALAGGWTQAPGAYYLKIWNRSLLGRDVVLRDGTIRRLDGTFQDHHLQLYGEVGLASRLTWVGYVSPVGYARYQDQGQVYMGPAWTGARLRLFRMSSVVLSAQVTAGGRPPVGDAALFTADVNGEPVVFRPTLSTGQVDGELQLGVGAGDWWVAVNAGGRGFTNAVFNPAVYGYAQVGWKGSQHVVVDLHVPVYVSLGQLNETDVLGVTNTRYLGAGLTGSYWFSEHVAVTGSVEGVAFVRSNAATPALNLGVELR